MILANSIQVSSTVSSAHPWVAKRKRRFHLVAFSEPGQAIPMRLHCAARCTIEGRDRKLMEQRRNTSRHLELQATTSASDGTVSNLGKVCTPENILPSSTNPGNWTCSLHRSTCSIHLIEWQHHFPPIMYSVLARTVINHNYSRYHGKMHMVPIV